MENTDYTKCSYYNCDKSFAKEYFSPGLKAPPINFFKY